VQAVGRDGNCLFQSISLLLDGEDQYNILRQKAVQYVYVVSKAKSFNHQQELLMKLRVKEVSLFCVGLTTTIIR
jgi:hypothetical protein